MVLLMVPEPCHPLGAIGAEKAGAALALQIQKCTNLPECSFLFIVMAGWSVIFSSYTNRAKSVENHTNSKLLREAINIIGFSFQFYLCSFFSFQITEMLKYLTLSFCAHLTLPPPFA